MLDIFLTLDSCLLILNLKRIYNPADKADGLRILVDRLWPRGVTKERAQIDRWMKDIAPSTELRKQYHANPQNWAEFQHNYIAELRQSKEAINELVELIKTHDTVTLLYSVHDEQQNHAVVLREFLLTIHPL
ncbi:Uncharacterized conserved protein YeaO, DUF488 family [Mucilaginibacter sp. OK268]|nr:Uncharacterized conserved protein YeaO, DUF488 family [Mucilaginibacter sp. OK268]